MIDNAHRHGRHRASDVGAHSDITEATTKPIQLEAQRPSYSYSSLLARVKNGSF